MDRRGPMAEGNPRERPKSKTEPEIAAAELLFREDSPKTTPKPAPGSSPNPPAESKEVFDLVDLPEASESTAPVPVAPIPAAPRKGEGRAPRLPRADRREDASGPSPSELVEEVWSRISEWGQTLIVLGVWLAVVAFLVYMLLDFGLGPAFLALLMGGAVAVVLSYPILITLERPVRVTPEQAVRDYYAALSHHFPHYKRMWLLLSKAGRVSTQYGSFEGFKTYWKETQKRLREGHAGAMTPLVFLVADFKADKSAGKTRLDAEFAVSVLVRGQRQAGPI